MKKLCQLHSLFDVSKALEKRLNSSVCIRLTSQDIPSVTTWVCCYFNTFGKVDLLSYLRNMRLTCLLSHIVLSLAIGHVNTVLTCLRGEKYHTPKQGDDVCIVCQGGTYMPIDDHTLRKCVNCTKIVDPEVEILVSPCNRFRDSVILCKDGYYRYTAYAYIERDVCKVCTDCEYPERACQGYTDAVCCDLSQGANTTKAGAAVCKERPVVCGAGQFFRTSSEECLPCPAGTFMSDHSHTYKDCLTCEELSENNLTQAVIIRPCSRTAPTLFGCKAGYFRDPTQESLQIEVPCTPCRICNRRLTACGMFHDAVCDDEARMVSTAPTDFTVSTGTREVVDMIIQLNVTFRGSVNDCIRHCLQATIAKSESSKRECLSSCFLEINEAYHVFAWLSFSFHTVLFVFINRVIWLIPNYLDADNLGKWHLHVRRYTYVVFGANFVGIILFILKTLLTTRVIEDMGYGVAISITVCCYVVLTMNPALLLMLMFVKSVRPNNLQLKNIDKVEETCIITLNTRQIEIPDDPKKRKQQVEIRLLQKE